jgi:hypothetical protein
MRIPVSIDRAKRVAKLLKRESGLRGYTLNISKCQAVTALMFGFENWNQLLSQGAQDDTSWDNEVASPQVATRIAQYVKALTTGGIAAADAVSVVEAIQPTVRPSTAPASIRRLKTHISANKSGQIFGGEDIAQLSAEFDLFDDDKEKRFFMRVLRQPPEEMDMMFWEYRYIDELVECFSREDFRASDVDIVVYGDMDGDTPYPIGHVVYRTTIDVSSCVHRVEVLHKLHHYHDEDNYHWRYLELAVLAYDVQTHVDQYWRPIYGTQESVNIEISPPMIDWQEPWFPNRLKTIIEYLFDNAAVEFDDEVSCVEAVSLAEDGESRNALPFLKATLVEDGSRADELMEAVERSFMYLKKNRGSPGAYMIRILPGGTFQLVRYVDIDYEGVTRDEFMPTDDGGNPFDLVVNLIERGYAEMFRDRRSNAPRLLITGCRPAILIDEAEFLERQASEDPGISPVVTWSWDWRGNDDFWATSFFDRLERIFETRRKRLGLLPKV